MCLHGLCIGLEHIAIEFLFRFKKKPKNTFSKEEHFGSQEDELTALPCADCRSRRPHAHGRRVRPRSDAGVSGRLPGARGPAEPGPPLRVCADSFSGRPARRGLHAVAVCVSGEDKSRCARRLTDKRRAPCSPPAGPRGTPFPSTRLPEHGAGAPWEPPSWVFQRPVGTSVSSSIVGPRPLDEVSEDGPRAGHRDRPLIFPGFRLGEREGQTRD